MRHGPSFHSGPLNWLLLKGAEPPPAARRKASGFSRHSILGLPIGSLRGDHIPSHEQSFFGVTPLDLLGEGWSVNQLNLIFLGWRDPGAATESKPESRAKPVVEAAVDDRIVHGGAHGQPEECQVDLLDELVAVDVLLEAAQEEVEVVGQPADGECHHHQYHGLHKLAQERLGSLLSLETPSPGVGCLSCQPEKSSGPVSVTAPVPWIVCYPDTLRLSTSGLLLRLVPLLALKSSLLEAQLSGHLL